MATSPRSERGTRLADRLDANRRDRFIGREVEVSAFSSALQAEVPEVALFHVWGPGGIGKSALLREFARIAAEFGRPVALLDGAAITPGSVAFRLALEETLSAAGYDTSFPDRGVLLIDTWETLVPLERWFRDLFLPSLPGRSLVVLAGRTRPASLWQSDPGWAGLTRAIRLNSFSSEESSAFLTARGVSSSQHDAIMAFARGYPLVLALAGDAVASSATGNSFRPADSPDIVRTLLERFLDDVPTPLHRQALEVCTISRTTTEALLAEVLDIPDASDLFAWLCGLSFVEARPDGIVPHDVVREILDAELRWRNPEEALQVSRRLSSAFYSRMRTQNPRAAQRVWFDVLHLHRKDPLYQPYFDWEALDKSFAMPASSDDVTSMLDLVRRHQGVAEACIAHHWFCRQPQGFLIYQDVDGNRFGFMAQISLREVTEDDVRIDPALPALQTFVQRYGPVRPDEEILVLRFWMHAEAYQGQSPAVNLTAINSSIAWSTRPGLAWNFIVVSDPAFLEQHFASVQMWRAPEADFLVENRSYAVFAHDWRREPLAEWLSVKTEPKFAHAHPGWPRVRPPRELHVLEEREFAVAVRQALSDFSSPERLIANPLTRTRLISATVTARDAPGVLQRLLQEAVGTLEHHPRTMKFHRALWHTYLEPAPTQEAVAELLGLPFNTYRYHLNKGLERVTAFLWRLESESSS